MRFCSILEDSKNRKVRYLGVFSYLPDFIFTHSTPLPGARKALILGLFSFLVGNLCVIEKKSRLSRRLSS